MFALGRTPIKKKVPKAHETETPVRFARQRPDSQESIPYINTNEFPDKSENNDKHQYQKLRLTYYTGAMFTRYSLSPTILSVIPRMESIITLIQKFYSETRTNDMMCFVNLHIKTGHKIHIRLAETIDYDTLNKERKGLKYIAHELIGKLPSKSKLVDIYNGKIKNHYY